MQNSENMGIREIGGIMEIYFCFVMKKAVRLCERSEAILGGNLNNYLEIVKPSFITVRRACIKTIEQ